MARPFLPEHSFWGNVAISAFDEACWPWKARTQTVGYGICRFRGESNVLAHRAAYMIEYGEIPDGLFVLHECDFKLCCNPKHLRLGSQQENLADMRRKGRGYTFPIIFGEDAPHAKLTDEQVAEIRQRYRLDDISQTELATLFKIGQSQISRIIRGENRVSLTTDAPVRRRA